jgi:hypothetical protein
MSTGSPVKKKDVTFCNLTKPLESGKVVSDGGVELGAVGPRPECDSADGVLSRSSAPDPALCRGWQAMHSVGRDLGCGGVGAIRVVVEELAVDMLPQEPRWVIDTSELKLAFADTVDGKPAVCA